MCPRALQRQRTQPLCKAAMPSRVASVARTIFRFSQIGKDTRNFGRPVGRVGVGPALEPDSAEMPLHSAEYCKSRALDGGLDALGLRLDSPRSMGHRNRPYKQYPSIKIAANALLAVFLLGTQDT